VCQGRKGFEPGQGAITGISPFLFATLLLPRSIPNQSQAQERKPALLCAVRGNLEATLKPQHEPPRRWGSTAKGRLLRLGQRKAKLGSTVYQR